MPRATAKKPPMKLRPKKAKPVVSAGKQAPPQTGRPAVKTTGYVVGARVSHPKFGDGTVTAVDADKLTIRFKGGRERQSVDAFVRRSPQ